MDTKTLLKNKHLKIALYSGELAACNTTHASGATACAVDGEFSGNTASCTRPHSACDATLRLHERERRERSRRRKEGQCNTAAYCGAVSITRIRHVRAVTAIYATHLAKLFISFFYIYSFFLKNVGWLKRLIWTAMTCRTCICDDGDATGI